MTKEILLSIIDATTAISVSIIGVWSTNQNRIVLKTRN
jgi:hypothetical protein